MSVNMFLYWMYVVRLNAPQWCAWQNKTKKMFHCFNRRDTACHMHGSYAYCVAPRGNQESVTLKSEVWRYLLITMVYKTGPGILAVLERETVSHPLRLFVWLPVAKVGLPTLSVRYDYKYAFRCQYHVFNLAEYWVYSIVFVATASVTV